MRERKLDQPLWSKILSVVLALVLVVMGIGLFFGYQTFRKLTNFDSGSSTSGGNSQKGALTIHVPEDAKTIAEALTQADDGDTIVLAAGTYSDPVDDNGLTVGMGIHKSITVQGAGRDKTILDGKNKTQHGIYIPQVDKTIVVKDLTVQNFENNGAEVSGKNVTISGVTFKNNGGTGAAFHFVSRDSVFKNNIVVGSRFNGISTEKAAVRIFNNTLVSNGSTGIYIVVADDDPTSSSPAIYNNIIGKNATAGILYESPAHPAQVAVDHNNLYGNKNNYFEYLNNDKTKSKAVSPTPGTGSLTKDPGFPDATYQLPEGSALKTAGRDGVEMGAFGGIAK